MKKLILLIILILRAEDVFLHGITEPIVQWVNNHQATTTEEDSSYDDTSDEDADEDSGGISLTGHISSAEDLNLHDEYGGGTNYVFTYNGEEFRAQYYYDNWTIYDSYKITNKHDMKIICQALIDIHPIHGKDYESYRTADDMVYEWKQHNLAYKYLPEDNAWRPNAANVDFDPEDQGRSFEEIYEDRTGQELDLKGKVKESIEDGTFFDKVKRVLGN